MNQKSAEGPSAKKHFRLRPEAVRVLGAQPTGQQTKFIEDLILGESPAAFAGSLLAECLVELHSSPQELAEAGTWLANKSPESCDAFDSTLEKIK